MLYCPIREWYGAPVVHETNHFLRSSTLLCVILTLNSSLLRLQRNAKTTSTNISKQRLDLDFSKQCTLHKYNNRMHISTLE